MEMIDLSEGLRLDACHKVADLAIDSLGDGVFSLSGVLRDDTSSGRDRRFCYELPIDFDDWEFLRICGRNALGAGHNPIQVSVRHYF